VTVGWVRDVYMQKAVHRRGKQTLRSLQSWDMGMADGCALFMNWGLQLQLQLKLNQVEPQSVAAASASPRLTLLA